MKSTTKPRQGGAVLSVRVKSTTGGEDETFESETGIFESVKTHLSDRFRLAFSAPSCSGQLFDDIGYIGDTETTQQILEGTYVFPADLDPATKLLLEEAAITYASMSKEDVANYVSVADFQLYWQRADERVASSFSRLHFGHYKAASFDPALSSLHAAKLSICAKMGYPLAR